MREECFFPASWNDRNNYRIGMKEETCSFLCRSCNYALFGPYYLAFEERSSRSYCQHVHLMLRPTRKILRVKDRCLRLVLFHELHVWYSPPCSEEVLPPEPHWAWGRMTASKEAPSSVWSCHGGLVCRAPCTTQQKENSLHVHQQWHPLEDRLLKILSSQHYKMILTPSDYCVSGVSKHFH